MTRAPRRALGAYQVTRGSMRAIDGIDHVGMDLGGHQALVAVAEADQHALAGAQLGDTVAAQRFHMNEDVLGALAASQEAEALGAVEPLDDGAFEPARRRDLHMGADRRKL